MVMAPDAGVGWACLGAKAKPRARWRLIFISSSAIFAGYRLHDSRSGRRRIGDRSAGMVDGTAARRGRRRVFSFLREPMIFLQIAVMGWHGLRNDGRIRRVAAGIARREKSRP
ncbi:hypothetical protein [Cupriavidus necator]|uniref:hypothetical protein n=1 Tax=Cupriavidus necator TaxID=106590 RepID=UPI00278551D8|nr:hypothetical protein [Cupriavidus necator]MDQ0143169.1 hypothetical protein [Cupriavidus necator]